MPSGLAIFGNLFQFSSRNPTRNCRAPSNFECVYAVGAWLLHLEIFLPPVIREKIGEGETLYPAYVSADVWDPERDTLAGQNQVEEGPVRSKIFAFGYPDMFRK